MNSAALKYGGAAALLVAAFAVGRYTAAEPETRIEERLVHSQTVITKTRVITETKRETARVVYRDRVVTPDGTVKEREIEREETKEETRTDSDSSGETKSNTEADRKLTVTQPRPNWHVGALVGGQLSLAPLGVAPVYGGLIERRVAGPFSVGAWALSNGTGGVSLSVEF
jgi:hypothetical protein